MKKQIIALILILLAAGLGRAQISQSEFIRHQYLKPAVHFKSWDFGEGAGIDKFIELAAPITYSTAISPRIGVDVTTTYFITAFNSIPSLSDLSEDDLAYWHLTDTFVRGSLLLGDNLALLTVGVGIPTGEATLSGKDLAFAGIAANRPLDNPVSSFGSGSSVNVGLAMAHELQDWVVGIGLGYSKRSDYDATFFDASGTVQSGSIDPGDELNVTIGAEREFEFAGNTGKFISDLIYTNYSKDEFGGFSTFEAGDKIVARAQMRIPLAIFNPIVLSVIHRWRLDNTSTNAALIENGNELDFRATAFLPVGGALALKSVVQTQLYYSTPNESEDATIYGIGGGFVLNLSKHFSFDPTVVYHTGTINSRPNPLAAVKEIDVTGIEVFGGFAFKF